MKKIYLYIGTLSIAILMLVSYQTVNANPSRITAPASCTTSGGLSTTSISYMSPGLATTTLTCNLQLISAIAGGADSSDSGVLAVQFHASSSPSSELDFVMQISQDGKDWYSEKLYSSATSSNVVGGNRTYSWFQYASTTQSYSLSGLATSSVAMGYFPINTSSKYVRFNFSVPIGSLNAGVWAQVISKAQKI